MNNYTQQEKAVIHIEHQPVNCRSEDSVYMTKKQFTPVECIFKEKGK